MLYNFLKQSYTDSFSPIVLSLIDGDVRHKLEKLGVRVIVSGTSSSILNILHFFVNFYKVVKNCRPKLIHSWMYHANILSFIAKKMFCSKLPIIWSIHNSLYSFKNDKLFTNLVNYSCMFLSTKVNKIHFVSATSLRQHINFGYSSDNAVVIPNGFDTKKFTPVVSNPINFRQNYQYSQSHFIVGMVARYDSVKNHLGLIEAASIISRKYPNIYFVIVGKGVVKAQSLIVAIKEHGIKNIQLCCEIRRIEAFYPEINVLCSPSFSEAFPMSIGEAMACGVPCVGTNVGDTKILIGDAGVVIDNYDGASIANGIEALYMAGRKAREGMGKLARNRIQENYSISSVSKRYIDLYCTIIIK